MIPVPSGVRAYLSTGVAAEARVSSTDALIASLKLQIEKLRRELHGQRSERKARLLDQMELELEELEASATEDELKAEMAAEEAGTEVKAFTRRKPSGKPFPSICRANGWCSPVRRPATAADRRGLPSLARTSPGRPRSSRGNGR